MTHRKIIISLNIHIKYFHHKLIKTAVIKNKYIFDENKETCWVKTFVYDELLWKEVKSFLQFHQNND